MKIKVSDYIARFLAQRSDIGNEIFMVTGGAAMHINDSLGRQPGLRITSNHHEQACAIAAEGAARLSNKTGVCVVTSGPGGTNALTGVLGAWLDSIPMIVISGQVKFATTTESLTLKGLRQLGDQELQVTRVVRPISKYAQLVTDANEIRYHLEKAAYLAKSGRPGPVWLDVPLCVQSTYVTEEHLRGFSPPPPREPTCSLDTSVDAAISMIQASSRPVIIAGNGITLSGANNDFLELIQSLSIPVLSTFARYDIVRDDHPLHYGRSGSVGQRSANFIVQNSDLVLGIGARFNIRAVGHNWKTFARAAKKIVVDVDPNELDKGTIIPDLKIESDAGAFIRRLTQRLRRHSLPSYETWTTRCGRFRKDFPVTIARTTSSQTKINSYDFFSQLSVSAGPDAVFTLANGSACVSAYQTLALHGRQRVIVNSGCASMGYALPAAIGACRAHNDAPIICVTGEGSMQMNLQEFQTIVHHQLPIKLFVLNNAGYSSIRNTQNAYFDGFAVGTGPESGLSFPDTLKIADAYGLPSRRLNTPDSLLKDLREIFAASGPYVCELMIDPSEVVAPKLSSRVRDDGTLVSSPLEDLYPHIDRDLLRENMIIPPLEI